MGNNLSYKLIPMNNLSQSVFYTAHHTDFSTSQKCTAETKSGTNDLHSINGNLQEMRDGNKILIFAAFISYKLIIEVQCIFLQ